MSDPRTLRRIRLENEYRELMAINGSIIRIEPLGSAPYERYRITYNIRTIISPRPEYRDSTVCELSIPAGYPQAVPRMEAITRPVPWHVNWFTSGSWCHGHWDEDSSLANFIYRCAKVLQFDPEFANPGSSANSEALSFWHSNKNNRRVIPCDTQALPDPSGEVQAPQIPRIIIGRRNEATTNQSNQSTPRITIKPRS